MEKRLAVFVSGRGSLLEPIARTAPIHLVIADRPCPAVEVARGLDLLTVEYHEHKLYGAEENRQHFTRNLAAQLRSQKITHVALAGFRKILHACMFTPDLYKDRVVNVHPSLLPAFPGAYAVRDALRAGVTETGCTVHVVTEKVDDGLILAQEVVPILPGDTEETLHGRINDVERKLFPQVIRSFMGL